MVKKIANLLLIIFFLSSLNCNSARDISDDEMIKNFQNNEADFEKLRQMATEDSEVMRIGYDFTWLKDDVSFPRPKSEKDLSEERWNEYRSLFKKLNLKDGIINYENQKILFFMSKGKDYVYSVEEPSAIFNSLDKSNFDRPEFKGKSRKIQYRKLKDNWYLYFEL
jgi:hypothetical protein